MKRVLIAAPLEYELAPLREKLDQESSAVRPTFLVLDVGPKKSVKTLEKFLEADPEWDLVLIVGLAGGLTEDMKTGDIVTPSLIMDGNFASNPPLKIRGEGRGAEASTLPRNISSSVGGVMFHNPSSSPYLKGREEVRAVPFLTVNRILKPSEKQKALEEHPEAQVVDMESFCLAGLCLRKRLSFKIFRSILDEKDYIFPDFRWIFSQGKLGDVVPFLFYCLRHPRKAARVLDFRKKVRESLVRLTVFMALYLEHLTK